MKLYIVKALGLTALMFALTLGGMQAANDGISRIKGYGDPAFRQPVSVEKDGPGELKVAIMGGDGKTLRFNEGNGKETDSFNFFSSMGKALTSVLSGAVRGILEFFSQ
ncbi:hypothetical protein DRW41_18475 [Neobacillus piezotolerans]|uniref:DUF3679 domain-containing protein n=1 Tax=Neobacillus piezotolerans TaxID=2259171 RepID=A0A3D8GLZ6_9BACI|nr:DUF3679 domain-containing protein [Neobacillus piezotolerans]RDU35443.1 hypothetical protein DRW41_18475 [Neobacillus piezotolerans]